MVLRTTITTITGVQHMLLQQVWRVGFIVPGFVLFGKGSRPWASELHCRPSPGIQTRLDLSHLGRQRAPAARKVATSKTWALATLRIVEIPRPNRRGAVLRLGLLLGTEGRAPPCTATNTCWSFSCLTFMSTQGPMHSSSSQVCFGGWAFTNCTPESDR